LLLLNFNLIRESRLIRLFGGDNNRPIDTTVNLFDAEMKYLHDNGFKVLTMTDLANDENSQSLYINST
jgi:hypothetical protein